MPGYNLPFVSPVPRNCVCPLCRLPMRDAVKINSCNHKYCDSCLQEFLSKGVFVCPKDQTSLEDTQVVADEKLDEAVRSCRVSCPVVKDGCRWAGSLRDLEKHVGECSFSKVTCPRQCGVVVARRAIDNHMSLVCPKRKVICENCGLEFTGDTYQTHSLGCRRGPNLAWCENKCGVRLDASERRHHEERVCSKRAQLCQRCGREFTAETIHVHQRNCATEKTLLACQYKEFGCSFEAPNDDLAAHHRSSAHLHLDLLLGVVEAQRTELARLRSQVKGLARTTNGVYVWRVDDFARRFTEAQTRRQRAEPQLELLSEAFYSSAPTGYKLQASLFLDGNGPGAGHFLSAYVKLLPGDFDPLLAWPFTHAVSFALLDQEGGRGVEATFSPSPAWWAKQRAGESPPSDDEPPLGFGFPKLVSHAQLFEVGGRFVRRDAMFLQIGVDRSGDEAAKSSRFSSI